MTRVAGNRAVLSGFVPRCPVLSAGVTWGRSDALRTCLVSPSRTDPGRAKGPSGRSIRPEGPFARSRAGRPYAGRTVSRRWSLPFFDRRAASQPSFVAAV
ncbi:hypothetical protein Acsp07_37300 [Actinomycetospora sp. NBRC 106378]|nr:hypothetical protein Acsp07_37300 [Actinomycetospora sp. NBRC 106378]